MQSYRTIYTPTEHDLSVMNSPHTRRFTTHYKYQKAKARVSVKLKIVTSMIRTPSPYPFQRWRSCTKGPFPLFAATAAPYHFRFKPAWHSDAGLLLNRVGYPVSSRVQFLLYGDYRPTIKWVLDDVRMNFGRRLDKIRTTFKCLFGRRLDKMWTIVKLMLDDVSIKFGRLSNWCWTTFW